MNASADLTPRQSKFVANFLVTGNGTQAAMAAGYSQVSARVGAHRLLTKVAVRAAIAAAQAIVDKARQATEAEHARMLAELRHEVGRLVVEATAKVTGKVLTLADQQRLAEETNRELAA